MVHFLGGGRPQARKTAAAVATALNDSDDDDLPLAVQRNSDSGSRQPSVATRSSKGRLSTGGNVSCLIRTTGAGNFGLQKMNIVSLIYMYI